MTITEFLTARLDEDEALLRSAPPGARHVDYHASDSPDTFSPSCAVCVAGWPGRDRFLADLAAKRAIVAAWIARGDDDHPAISAHRTGLGLAIQHLVQPHAEHPDFDEAWRA